MRTKIAQEGSRENAPAVRVRSEAGETGKRRHQPGPGAALLNLQRTRGNRFVQALLNGVMLQRKCACGGQCAECAKKKELQRSAAGPAAVSEAPPVVHQVLRSPGQPLNPETRVFFESRFGQDFSGVRIHTGGRASYSAASVNALAYTVGNNIVFAGDQYRPGSHSGRRLLAHELAHVVQQGGVSSSSIQRQIPIGSVNDPAENEADRVADAVLSGSPAKVYPETGSAAVIRRVPTEPQGVDDKRTGTIKLSDGDTVEMTRTFHSCPCSRVTDTRTGIFYNPDLDNLSIAYRRCRGSTTFDVYLKTATDFAEGNVPPQGSAQIGIDVNVWGKNVQGRLIVELVGQNRGSGPGIGGHAKLVFQGGKWRVILDSEFLRQLGNQTPGTNPNQLEVDLGARYGKFRVQLSGKDLLSATRTISGTACYELSDDICVGAGFDVQGSSTGQPTTTGGLRIEGRFGEGARKEVCYQCYCPAPVKKFTCVKHHHVPEKQPPPIKEERSPESRYYFHYNSTANSEADYLRAESTKNMDDMAALVKRGYRIISVTGFASPEGLEREVNDPLAASRAKKTVEIVRAKVDPSVTVPEGSVGRSELLGRNPAAPSTHLREAIEASGLHSAEAVTPLLTGAEILPAQMTKEFLDLFEKTAPDEWMQLFGLNTDNPIRPQVEAAVRAFLATKGKGSRPWERVFRLLRFGAVRLSGFEMVPDTKTPPTPAQDIPDTVSEADCKDYGAQAEKEQLLGPIDKALHPRASDAESDQSCFPPAPDDLKAGCDYTVPAKLTGKSAPTAPEFAPNKF